MQVFEFALPPLPKMDQKSMQMSAALKAKMNQARAKREQIEKLKTEKKRLLIEVYRPLETRLEQETGVITEKLVELENRLLSLREEAAKVPNEVADLAGEQERIVQVAGEMHRLYAQTDSQMTRSLNTLNQAHADAQRRLAQAREILEAQRKQGEELEQQSSQLQSLQEQTQERIRLAQEALATQAARIETGLEGLRQMESLRGQLDEQIQAGKGDMESQKSLLSEIEHQLGRIDEVQHWVQEHQVEYNSRMTRLTQYASNASAEYKKLKAAIDSGYVHRYLRDLRALSDSYEFELSQAQQTETDIDARLDETKKALSMLIAQARELADTQEMHLTQPAGTDEQMEGHSQEMDKASSDLLDATSDIVSHGVSRQKLREHVRRVRTDEEEAEPLPDSAPVSVVIEPPAGVMMRKGKDLSRKKVKTRPKE